MLKRLLFLLLLLLSLLSTLFSEVVLTDQEAEEIIIETEKSDKLLETNEIILQSSDKAILTLQNNSITTSESYEKIINIKESQITELEKSSIMQRIFDGFIGFLLSCTTIFLISIANYPIF